MKSIILPALAREQTREWSRAYVRLPASIHAYVGY